MEFAQRQGTPLRRGGRGLIPKTHGLHFFFNNDKDMQMKDSLVRTLVVMACGVVMALAAYAGQAGSGNDPRPLAAAAAATVPSGY
jgi:hypothetical protein